ncbi:hypothetical protein HK105_209297 [Polyrhizophydium stewartii]|uniref:Uncharacterized protein n=1 Tax=Polyrhizophydium stewartii TaxID=2732419 RepID=A0ABR4MVF9_9FUNG
MARPGTEMPLLDEQHEQHEQHHYHHQQREEPQHLAGFHESDELHAGIEDTYLAKRLQTDAFADMGPPGHDHDEAVMEAAGYRGQRHRSLDIELDRIVAGQRLSGVPPLPHEQDQHQPTRRGSRDAWPDDFVRMPRRDRGYVGQDTPRANLLLSPPHVLRTASSSSAAHSVQSTVSVQSGTSLFGRDPGHPQAHGAGYHPAAASPAPLLLATSVRAGPGAAVAAGSSRDSGFAGIAEADGLAGGLLGSPHAEHLAAIQAQIAAMTAENRALMERITRIEARHASELSDMQRRVRALELRRAESSSSRGPKPRPLSPPKPAAAADALSVSTETPVSGSVSGAAAALVPLSASPLAPSTTPLAASAVIPSSSKAEQAAIAGTTPRQVTQAQANREEERHDDMAQQDPIDRQGKTALPQTSSTAAPTL